jgi:hypothetical protein
MVTEKVYSASLTGEPLQFFESKVVAQLITDGLKFNDIKTKVYDENLFNYKTKKSIYKRVASVYKRIKNLDPFLIEIIANGTSSDAKALLIFSLMKSNRLFYEFMVEVVRNKFREMDYILSKKDLNIFFERKREQNNKIAQWHEYTIYKLTQVILKILTEVELITKQNDEYMLKKIMISNNIEKYFLEKNNKLFLDCIGG